MKKEIPVFDKDDQLRVARIDLVFDNEEMIGLLRDRGTAINGLDKDTVQKTEE